jgi:hypothetical protein
MTKRGGDWRILILAGLLALAVGLGWLFERGWRL